MDEARNAFDQTRIATQSCPYKFTTVLLKTSAHLVKKSWTDFKAYVESHGVGWSVHRRATGCARTFLTLLVPPDLCASAEHMRASQPCRPDIHACVTVLMTVLPAPGICTRTTKHMHAS